jgi:hypothetical protein
MVLSMERQYNPKAGKSGAEKSLRGALGGKFKRSKLEFQFIP